MSNPFDRLTPTHLDVLKEIGNIGSGHAATSLSVLLGKHIHMSVPRVSLVHLSQMDQLLGFEKLVAAVYFRVSGDIPGHVFYMLPLDSAKSMLSILLGLPVDEVNDFERSTLGEIGNILTGSYLSALSNLTGIDLQPSIPAIAIDMLGSVMQIALIDALHVGDYALFVDTQLRQGDHAIDGQFFFLPDPGMLRRLFEALGVPI